MPETEDVSLGGPDTHVPALDGDTAEPTGADTQDQDFTALNDATEDTVAATGDEDAPVEESATDDDALLQQFSKRTGLSPDDPAQRKTLDTLVAKEKFIQELQGKLAAQQDPAKAQQSPLTKFEQEQQAAADKAAQATQSTQPPQMPVIGQYNDVGAAWQSPTEGYKALGAAWAHAQETGDMSQVIQTEAALYERRFDAIGLPKVQAMMEARLDQFMQQHFGEVMPQLQMQAREVAAEEAKEFAFRELESTEGFKDIRSLTQEQEGPPLTVNGEQYSNTPLNRIIAENPWIMHIKREAADSKVADRLTYLARLKAAHSINSKGRISTETAKALVSAGSKQEQRKSQDTVRQSLNRGGTPSKALDKGGAKPKTYMEELLGVGEGPVSFSDL